MRLARSPAFWVLAAILTTFLLAASAPSPLYVVFQQRFGFSSTTLTEIFAIYAVMLLAALVTVGALSDHVGRRPVLAAALVIEIASMLVFAAANDVTWLFVARALQGLATGTATGALTAGLVDLQPRRAPQRGALVNSVAPSLGLAAGALGSGVLVQIAPSPTTLVFVALAIAFAVALVGVAVLPEPVQRRPGALASLRPAAGLPPGARAMFLVVAPCLIAVWALGGLYLSLGPSLVADTLGLPSHITGGLVITTLAGCGGIASLLARNADAERVMRGGAIALSLGVAVTLVALAATSTAGFFVGTAIAGLGFGAGFLGALRTLTALAEPDERAALFATIYTVSYLAFSLPAVAAGLAVTADGLPATATVYGLVVIALSLAAVVGLARQARRAAARTRACPAEC